MGEPVQSLADENPSPSTQKLGFWKSLVVSWSLTLIFSFALKGANYFAQFPEQPIKYFILGFWILSFLMFYFTKIDNAVEEPPFNWKDAGTSGLRGLWVTVKFLARAAAWVVIQLLDGKSSSKPGSYMKTASFAGIQVRYSGECPRQYKSAGGVRYYRTDGTVEVLYPDTKSSKENVFEGKSVKIKIR